MKNNKGLYFPKWLLLPILSYSCAVWAGNNYNTTQDLSPLVLEDDIQAVPSMANNDSRPSVLGQAQDLSEQASGFVNDANEQSQISTSYMGANTRIGIGVDSEFKGRIEASHVFSDSANSVTSGEAWAGVDVTADRDAGEEILTGAGIKVNHNWVGKDQAGNPAVVHKAFGAYDQNKQEDKKVTVGYGQETQNAFWSAQGSLANGDERLVGSAIEKPYDYGVGMRVGKFMPDPLMQVQMGLDAEWGKDYADNEDLPGQVTLSAGVEKFFKDSPYSVAANIEAYKKVGGYESDGDRNVEARGGVSYRYEFGGNNGLYEPNQTYRRVRVEIPGEVKLVKETKTVPGVPTKRVNRKMIKNTMELEGDTFFQVNSAVLTPEAQQRLTTIVGRIRQSGYYGNIQITGNTCDLGSDRSNQILSEQRASSVRSFFISQGVDPNILIAQGFGESRPKYPNTDEMRHRNRRVDIEYMTYETKYKDIVVDEMTPSRQVTQTREVRMPPRVVWRKELVQSEPKWVSRALRNNIQHKRTIDTYRTLGAVANAAEEGDTLTARNDVEHVYKNEIDVTLEIMNNDNSPDGKATKIEIVTQPVNGNVSVHVGNVKYTPNTDYSGDDSFVYRLIDSKGNISVPAKVEITINKCPMGGCVADLDPLDAKDDTYSISKGDTLSKNLNVLGNDIGGDKDNVKIVSVSEPKHGTATITPDGRYISYTLRHGYCADHSFTYIIEDDKGRQSSARVWIDIAD